MNNLLIAFEIYALGTLCTFLYGVGIERKKSKSKMEDFNSATWKVLIKGSLLWFVLWGMYIEFLFRPVYVNDFTEKIMRSLMKEAVRSKTPMEIYEEAGGVSPDEVMRGMNLTQAWVHLDEPKDKDAFFSTVIINGKIVETKED